MNPKQLLRRHGGRPNRVAGFTLMELMIVVAIVGILGGVAYPSYVENVQRGRRADAQAALLEASQFMQRHYAANNTFLNATLPTVLQTAPKGGANATYNITVANTTTATAFTLVATRTGAMTGDKCGNFTLTDTGLKAIASANSGVTAENCWR